MVSEELGDVLTLLAVTIVADKKVVSEEVQAFLTCAQRLQLAMDLKPVLTHARLMAWIELNQEWISHITKPEYYERSLETVFDRLSHLNNKESILEAMMAISEADNEVHANEHALMVMAARHWQIAPKSLRLAAGVSRTRLAKQEQHIARALIWSERKTG